MEEVSFKAHARIKDIVGKDPINNDNIAIIELIKNAKDAGLKKVYVIFNNSEDAEIGKPSGKRSKIQKLPKPF
jgi:hypothetical protein